METVARETITPEVALQMLATRPDWQRRQRKNRIEQYAEDMEEGRWGGSTDCIGITETGRLINGQHRLRAVVESGQTVEMWVMRGMSDDAYKTIDKGLPRSVADSLQDMPDASKMSTVARAVVAYEKSGEVEQRGRVNVSPVEQAEYARAHEDRLRRIVARFDAVRGAVRRISLRGWATFDWAHQDRYGEDRVEDFAHDVANLTGSRNAAMQMLNKAVIAGALSGKQQYQQYIDTIKLMAYTFEKWETGAGSSKCRYGQYDLRRLAKPEGGLL